MVGNATLHRTHQLCSSARVSNVKSLGSSRIATRRIALQTSLDASNISILSQITRRDVMSSLLAASLLLPVKPSLAEDIDTALEASAEAPVAAVMDELPLASTSGAASPSPANPTKVFMDIAINGEPAGRITFELFSDVTGGAARFAQLAAGRQGVDYRLSKFNGVLPTYIRNDGLSRLSYSATEISPIPNADQLDELEAELTQQTRRHDQPGLVSLIVREKESRPVKERLVARDGKFITVLEQAGEAPNGTQFTITTAPSPELDDTNLIIGRLLEGGDLLARISALPVNKPRNDNPYFQAGKAMGDKRAVTAERAFYRPFQKVVVASSGILS